MDFHTKSDTGIAASLLALSETDVAQYVRECVRERSLSTVVNKLNSDLLYGSTEESERARQALAHIGFSET